SLSTSNMTDPDPQVQVSQVPRPSQEKRHRWASSSQDTNANKQEVALHYSIPTYFLLVAIIPRVASVADQEHVPKALINPVADGNGGQMPRICPASPLPFPSGLTLISE
ncbi:hypothetical protein OS493_023702, partial [Desmophyllum pertusum]